MLFCGQTSWILWWDLLNKKKFNKETHKFQFFMNKLSFLSLWRALHRYMGFVNFYKKHISWMAKKPNHFYTFYKTSKIKTSTNITSEPKETFDSVIKVLSEASEFVLESLFPEKQLVLIFDDRCTLRKSWLRCNSRRQFRARRIERQRRT